MLAGQRVAQALAGDRAPACARPPAAPPLYCTILIGSTALGDVVGREFAGALVAGQPDVLTGRVEDGVGAVGQAVLRAAVGLHVGQRGDPLARVDGGLLDVALDRRLHLRRAVALPREHRRSRARWDRPPPGWRAAPASARSSAWRIRSLAPRSAWCAVSSSSEPVRAGLGVAAQRLVALLVVLRLPALVRDPLRVGALLLVRHVLLLLHVVDATCRSRSPGR